MERHRSRPWALHLLPLIACLQIPKSSAYPCDNQQHQNTSGPRNPSFDSYNQGHPPPIVNLSGTETSSWPSSTYSTGVTSWQPTMTVMQIPDGQIQEPYTVFTEELSSTSGTVTYVSYTTMTSLYSWAPGQSWWKTSSNTQIMLDSPTTYSPQSSSTSFSITSTSSSNTSTTSTSSSTLLLSSDSPWSSSSVNAITGQAGMNMETLTSTNNMSSITTKIYTTSLPDSSLTSLTTSAVQTATVSAPTNTTGTAQTSLETSGNPSSQPILTSVATATSSLSLVDTSTLSSVAPTASANVTSVQATDIFQAIATDAPPPQVSQRGDHPVPRLGIQPQSGRLETNKFYANFFLGDQTAGTWTHPYSVAWSKGAGETGSWGLAVSHVERDQLAIGAKDSWDAGEWAFFVNPIGIQSLVLSAVELGSNTSLTTDSLEAFSVNVNLLPDSGQDSMLTFPLVQGMSFVTGVYNGGTPLIQSGIGINNLTYVGAVVNGIVYKYRVELANGFTWLIYVTPSSSDYKGNSFTLTGATAIQGPSSFNGYIQVAKVPANSTDSESVYDGSAGAYPTAANITGSVQGSSGSYTLGWTKEGVQSQPLLMFALPHHLESFASSTSLGVTDLSLVTTTKGYAYAVRGDSWTLEEPDLPVSMGFSPWSPSQGNIQTVSSAAALLINTAGTAELAQNVSQQTNTGSMYYDGKALAKFAAIVYTLYDIAGNRTLALTGLEELESAFAFHVNGQQTYPLVYDTAWGGAVSISTYETGNSGDDFGNTYYSDHHFHYGYFVYAAAVIGYMDPDWLDEGANKAWVDMLVRDYANSIPDDPYFPFSRMFDWYHGHSWAHGLFEIADGKDQESSSEDSMSLYGMKMWGQITGDTNMEARGNLQLAIQARALHHYYLYTSNNTVEPSEFISNKAAGIVFENKIEHTTYFGTNPEYIEGIHMLPLMPFSTLTRTQDFVQEEWNAYFADGGIDPANQVQGGWRGILLANLAIIDPQASYDFFSNSTGDFNFGSLDGGASRTWYLAWSAALGGSPGTSKERKMMERNVRQVSKSVSRGNGDEHGYIAPGSISSGSKRSPRLRQRASGWRA